MSATARPARWDPTARGGAAGWVADADPDVPGPPAGPAPSEVAGTGSMTVPPRAGDIRVRVGDPATCTATRSRIPARRPCRGAHGPSPFACIASPEWRNPPNGAAPSLWTMARSGFVTPPTCSQSSGWKQHYRAKDRSSLDLGSRGHGIALELILSATERRALSAVGAAAGDRHPAGATRPVRGQAAGGGGHHSVPPRGAAHAWHVRHVP